MPIGGNYTAHKLLGYLPGFVVFAFRNFPLVRAVLALTLLAVLLELAALSLMIPLAGSTASASPIAQKVILVWSTVAGMLALPQSQQTWLWLFLVTLGLRTATGFLQMTLNFYVAKQIHASLSDRVFRRVVSTEPLALIFRKTVGHYVSMAGDETFKAGNIFFYMAQMLASSLSAAVGMAILFGFSQPVFWLTTAFIAVCGLLLWRVMKNILRLSSGALHLSRALNTNFIEALNGIRSIRSLSAEDFVVEGYRDQISRYVRLLRQIDILNQTSKSLPALLLILIGIVWQWPDAGKPANMTLYFVAITTMMIRILGALGEFVTAGGKLVADVRASQDAGSLLTAEGTSDGEGRRPLPASPVQRISMAAMSCGYEEGAPVVRGVNLEFRAGRTYALVGKSGSGKSTIADVLLGMLPVMAGEVRVDGVPISEISLASLRNRIVLVEQQTRIFSVSVRDNVTMGREATDADVLDALDGAGLGEFISKLPGGLAAFMDYQGANISGGQRQRLGIARALLRHPDVLILDEGTSAVDPEMKRELVNGLCRRFSSGIIVFVTHDAEVLAAVDEVWAVSNGEVLPVAAGGGLADGIGPGDAR